MRKEMGFCTPKEPNKLNEALNLVRGVFLPVVLTGIQLSGAFTSCHVNTHFKSGRVKIRSHTVKSTIGSELVG